MFIGIGIGITFYMLFLSRHIIKICVYIIELLKKVLLIFKNMTKYFSNMTKKLKIKGDYENKSRIL